jgi:predicted dehydrogenase
VSSRSEIGVGMLGYAFMGKAHSNAFRQVGTMAWPCPLVPKLTAIAGRDEAAVVEAAERYGYERWVTDWRDLVSDPEVGLFDNGGPNDVHAEPTIAAAEAGKHVLCEKPLGRSADESYEMWQRVAAAGVKHLCGFNYRFVPANRLARELIGSRCSALTATAPAGSRPCSSRRPTTRSGSGGGRRATSSAGSTPSCTRCTTC